MNEFTLKSFDLASSVVAQIITLSIATIGFEITILSAFVLRPSADETLKSRLSPAARRLLGASLSLLILSIAFGIWTQLELTGALASQSQPVVKTRPIAISATIEIFSFVLGVITTILFLLLSLLNRDLNLLQKLLRVFPSRGRHDEGSRNHEGGHRPTQSHGAPPNTRGRAKKRMRPPTQS